MSYCVYRHIRLDKNTPFYVGKGTKKRANWRHQRNVYWHNIVEKHGYIVEIIKECLTEERAFEKEKEFIALYKKYGWCEANFTDGGEGASGRVLSEESKLKMSKSHLGKKPWNKGKTHIYSEATLLKMRIASKENYANKREVLKEANIGNTYRKDKKHSTETKLKISKTKNSKYFSVFKENIFVGTWLSQAECAQKLGLQRTLINACLKNRRDNHKKYTFKYKENSNAF